MSLKAFHIIFIIASTVLATGFAAWAIRQYSSGDASTGMLALGIASLLLAAGLVAYGRYFLRKLKDIGYL
jgi:hypothetical protein